MRSLWRTNKETAEIYERNVVTVYRVCFLFFRGRLPDVEDAVQTTFLALMKDTKPFRDLEHEKAWLIVTASNICKNALASGWNKRVDMDEQSVQRLTVPFNIDETLQSVLINLVDNACAAGAKHVTVEAADHVLTVSDDGCGIPAEIIDRVTQPFFMADKARSRKQGNAGLGLALVSRIAELYHAALHIESSVGKGTKVMFTFPQ